MKFVVSSSELLSHLQAVSRVISSKTSLPILDNFLFQLEGKELTITASDLESTLITRMELDNTANDGSIAIPARILMDTLKEFSEQPLNFEVDENNLSIVISTQNGRFTVVGQSGGDFPQLPKIKKDKKTSLQLPVEILHNGINKTYFATADDELRPVMNGVFIELSPENMTFVASDSHKLVRYRRNDVKAGDHASFILPKKPAGILKAILPKDQNQVILEFDDKNASIILPKFTMVCRLVEGAYPNYNAVIPSDNPNKLTIDRFVFLNSLKRVSVYSSQASNLVRLDLKDNQLTVSAQDIDFSISAYEKLDCQYEGDELEIGFKSTFLIDILSNISSPDIIAEMSDSAHAGLLFPASKDNESEDILMLLMPMMVNG